MTTPAPYQYIVPQGIIVPDTSAILSGVQTEYQTVFGTDLIVTPDTPQGVLITAQSLARIEVVDNNAALANQINPNIAGGVFLDAIMALTGMQRTAATRTVVPDVTLTGVAGTIIPEGVLAKTSAGDQFASVRLITLDVSGNASVNFQSVEYGNIPCNTNELTDIVTNVLGWETVTNDNAGVPGASTQSDQATRALRQNTLAFQGVALAEAITSALYATEGVTSLWFQENVESTTQVINDISMVSHSIYVCVNGGTDTDVAAALLENKSSGCAWVGTEEITIIEPASGQGYIVKFDRPDEIAILVKVYTTNGNSNNIKQAVLDYAAGGITGFAGFVVGADVSPFEISGGILTEYPAYYISKVEITLASMVSYSTDVIPIAVNEIATIDISSISVVIA